MKTRTAISDWMMGRVYSLSQRCKPDEKISFIRGIPFIAKKTKWDFFMERVEGRVKNVLAKKHK